MDKAENINPEILVWARKTAGLSRAEAADRVGLTSSAEEKAEEKLADIESGRRAPTRKQLIKFSAVYRRPLVAFYLKEPPATGNRGVDFRHSAEAASKRENALLDALLRDVVARQEMVRELLFAEKRAAPRKFVGSASADTRSPIEVVNSISKVLGFNYTDPHARKGDTDTLFRTLRVGAEAAGIFVLLIGDLGSHHTALSADIFRGFAISDAVAPFVVINDQDARPARSFTLIHELAHIWLGETGVSGLPSPTVPESKHQRIERFCNDVAGLFLLPNRLLGQKPDDVNWERTAEIETWISATADKWLVSEPMVAYRLNRLNWITPRVYSELVKTYAARWKAFRQKQRVMAREAEGGPSYYTVRQYKLGSALVHLVQRTVREQLLTHTKAAKVLGIKPTSVEPLLRAFEGATATRTESRR